MEGAAFFMSTENNEVYLRLYLSAFSSGLVADLKPTNFTVLMTICSYMDAEGRCYPTQEQLSERSGLSKTTVNKAVNFLLEYTVSGVPLISREIRQKGAFKNSVYKVNPISQVAIFGGTAATPEIPKVEPADFTARDVGEYFSKVYHEVYGALPSINHARDYSNVKRKWIGKYTKDEIKTMVETGIREYDNRWKNPKFQRPTLSALTSWIGEQALALASNNEKEYQEASALTANYVDVNENALNRLQGRLNKG
jgi:hypothetical protein